jgi:hypothetical protein
MSSIKHWWGWCAPVAIAFGMTAWADAAPLPAEAKAVALVEARGGSIAYDDAGHVKAVDLAERPATDADLAVLAELPKLAGLEVWGAEISDSGMAAVARMAGLTQLALENTDVTDAGAAEIARRDLVEGAPAVVTPLGTVYLDLASTVDVGAEKIRLKKELDQITKHVAGTEARLANEAFVSKAPPAVLEGARRQLAEQQARRAELDRLLQALG